MDPADYTLDTILPPEMEATVTLPDGRTVKVIDAHFTERDTGAPISLPRYPRFEWDNGEELTAREMNEEIVVGEHYDAPVTAYLHEYVMHQADEWTEC